MEAGGLEARLEAPLVPLKHVKTARPQPGFIPSRPASLPSTAPFGAAWHLKHGQWTCETLAFPAAYPRSIARSTADSPPAGKANKKQTQDSKPPVRLSKDQIDKAVQDIVENQRDARSVVPDVARCNGPNPLWIAVNRYTPSSKGKHASSSKDPVTLIFAHANGFSKEVSPVQPEASRALYTHSYFNLHTMAWPTDMGSYFGGYSSKLGSRSTWQH